MNLEVHGYTVRRDGEVVAYLTYAGPVITVELPKTEAQKEALTRTVVGRLMRVTGSSPPAYDAWTALHPIAPTPSDTRIGEGLPMADAIAVILAQD